MYQTAETAQWHSSCPRQTVSVSSEYLLQKGIHALPLHPRTRLRKSLSLPVLTRNNAEQQCSKEAILLALLQFYFLDFLCLWVPWLSLHWGYILKTERIIVVSKN